MINIDLNVAQSIQAIASVIGAIAALLAWIRAGKAARTSASNGIAIEEVRHLTNSLTAKAITDAGAAGEDAGNLQGRKEQTEERRVEAVQIAKDAIDEARAGR